MNQFDPKELAAGTKIEHEHTQDDRLAQKIAMDHLGEDPHYYAKLKAAGLEEEGAMTPLEAGMANEAEEVVIIAPQAVAPVAQEKGQSQLTSSGLGKMPGGQTKPLVPSKTVAPETKIVNNKNTIGNTKTAPLNPNTDSDPVSHFCGQIAKGI
jgi:hypothetical protein